MFLYSKKSQNFDYEGKLFLKFYDSPALRSDSYLNLVNGKSTNKYVLKQPSEAFLCDR